MIEKDGMTLDEFAEMIGIIMEDGSCDDCDDVQMDEVNIDGDTITRDINLAGISKKDIQVSVVPERIVVGVNNSVHTTIALEAGVNPEKVKANHKNGMLTLKYPAHPDPYKVEIK